MNPREAHDWDRAARALLRLGHPAPDASGTALDAALRLTERANTVLGGAALTPQKVRAAWPTGSGGEEEATCRGCGCTENAPCEGGCQWAPDPHLLGDLCSRCADATAVITVTSVATGRRQVLHLDPHDYAALTYVVDLDPHDVAVPAALPAGPDV
ncbi:hypothetical protein [Thermomonospora cellulosilytica]|uniref:Uncharacterized protein n=1 Tax=Thermomonospora cellulosilytica TaxID=1411118 RepID=A0A7W3N1X6_9ACTN|nr:hypothetical protein [Thermomonospora cellulosilytica]MBA9005997.1 hypothetical protein [Thermomonospora cellulosilytica]